MEPFYQAAPELPDPFESDRALRAILRRRLAPQVYVSIEPDLRRFSARVLGDIAAMGREAEANPPRLIRYAPWGQRIDDVQVSRGWTELDRASAEEGLVATAYERAYGPASRVFQFAKLYLFHPSSAFYSCPLAMTDGAARVLETLGSPAQKARAFKWLTSRDPREFWTSGQWMTERTGGSDVSGTTTSARRAHGRHELWGDKWFTSAVNSQMALALARCEGEADGGKGLSLFYLELRDGAAGALRNIRVRRLKDKLGTRALPTAELELRGTPAELVGGEGAGAGGGVRKVAALLNITRLHNSVCAAASQARALALASDYAGRWLAFGKLLRDHPLHRETLASLRVEHEAGLQLVFEMVELMGKEECGEATAEESAILRLMTPVTKLFTGKTATRIASESLEAIGGAGYVEDAGVSLFYRDAQVFSIWEGTTNVLSLDVLRALAKDGALAATLARMRAAVASAEGMSALVSARAKTKASIEVIGAFAARVASEGEAFAQASARSFSLALARAYAASLLLEQSAWDARNGGARPESADVAARWCAEGLSEPRAADESWRDSTRRIFDGA